MPAVGKSIENMAKHLTKAEISQREQSEQDMMPARTEAMKPPPFLRGKAGAGARRYWKSIIARMEGYAILDELDAETLGIYCSQLCRRDALISLASSAPSDDGDDTADIPDVEKDLQALEKLLLSYAEKLGLTPQSRVALARKRAARAGTPGPLDDMFGD